MASNTKGLRRRIRSIKNTLQVTKALELISSVKMRKAVENTTRSRIFSDEIWRLISFLYPTESRARNKLPTLFRTPTSGKKELLLLIASDKGLAGSYNSNILRFAHHYVNKNKEVEFDVITVGKRAKKIKQLASNVNILSSFAYTGEEYDFFQSSPITKQMIDCFESGKYKKVSIIFTDFVNTLRQKVKYQQILPITKEASVQEDEAGEKGQTTTPPNDNLLEQYIFEPNKYALLDTLALLAVRAQIYQAMLEASASEHAARMVAMKNATENGNQLVTDLTFAFNQVRQGAITQEIAEISAGRIALSGQ
ncbi:MAG TPA: ATP synthase F1 subunit gamma [bacterium]|nr:ATP synthase F1 subunit gamma [bacterium]HOR57268.1 ATP synthase F1 subunit gamma [bacterium]HPL56354.1 ATP synthase F1 subunit gamma [bacterium]